MEKEIKINVPNGYTIDKENSTFECIKFKPIAKKWRDIDTPIHGYYINSYTVRVEFIENRAKTSYNVFATRKQAQSALAMAQISQIMANDKRFGGIVTDEEWGRRNSVIKYCICRENNNIEVDDYFCSYRFLAFHTREQRDLFLEENEDLVKQYLMID